MADACIPEKVYQVALPLLPPQKQPGPQGGRRPIDHHTVLKVIWFVLVTGCRWDDVPKEMGCCGETARTRLRSWERAGIWDRLHRLLLTRMHQQQELHAETAIIDTIQVQAFAVARRPAPAP